MEGLALILIGGALFAQSWNFLGLYSDGRMVGAFVGALGWPRFSPSSWTPWRLSGTTWT